jgi:hypothetical protein
LVGAKEYVDGIIFLHTLERAALYAGADSLGGGVEDPRGLRHAHPAPGLRPVVSHEGYPRPLGAGVKALRGKPRGCVMRIRARRGPAPALSTPRPPRLQRTNATTRCRWSSWPPQSRGARAGHPRRRRGGPCGSAKPLHKRWSGSVPPCRPFAVSLSSRPAPLARVALASCALGGPPFAATLELRLKRPSFGLALWTLAPRL